MQNIEIKNKNHMTGMSFDMLMDRDIIIADEAAASHYISPGSFAVTVDGRFVPFDFLDVRWSRDKDNPRLIHAELTKLDADYSPESVAITPQMLATAHFDDFFVFTGEDAGEPEIHPVIVGDLSFMFAEENREIPATADMVAEVNDNLTDGQI